MLGVEGQVNVHYNFSSPSLYIALLPNKATLYYLDLQNRPPAKGQLRAPQRVGEEGGTTGETIDAINGPMKGQSTSGSSSLIEDEVRGR